MQGRLVGYSLLEIWIGRRQDHGTSASALLSLF
jgi:hypothetical protein